MNTDHKLPTARGAAPGAGPSESPRAPRIALTLSADAPRTGTPERNTDPYNTSGSFDRTKNWARVGKR
jgi:hypothetical protein